MRKLNNILLIDDSPSTNEINKRLIEELVFPVNIYCFDFAAKAIEFIKNNDNISVDLIFLDLSMPAIDGFDFIYQYNFIKRENSSADSIIAVLSDYKYLENFTRQDAFYNAGIVDHIQKPLQKESISDLIDKYFLQ